MEEAQWNIEEAIKEFNADKEWAEKNKNNFKAPNQVVTQQKPKEGILTKLSKVF